MEWLDIVFVLLEDPMILSMGCDGLVDAFYALEGLYHMYELHIDLKNDFILEVINGAIKGRNRYCVLNGFDHIPRVILKENNFYFMEG